MTQESPLLIRADAGADIGAGHVMRCIALAQQWLAASAGPVTLLSARLPETLTERLAGEKISLMHLEAEIGSKVDVRKTAEAAGQINAGWIVLDGYSFDGKYQETLRNAGTKVLLLDDGLDVVAKSADIILNQNIYARPDSYFRCASDTRLLLGSRYALLRNEFNAWRDWRREVRQNATNVLVTLGGADRANYSEQLLVALDDYQQHRLRIKVIAGPASNHAKRLRELRAQSFHDIEVIENPVNMAALMAWADMLISAAGSTTLEAAFMGLPNVVGELAENQRPVADALVARQAAISVGRFGSLHSSDLKEAVSNLVSDWEVREQMSACGREMVDGGGGQRIVKHMLAPDVQLRPATWDDRRLLWQWVNQPSVRHSSFSQKRVDWDEHKSWFETKLRDDSVRMLIGVADGETFGLVRYTLQGESAVVSVNITEQCQGRGLGAALITVGSGGIETGCEVEFIDAYIKRDNEASLLAFTIAGFENLGEVVKADQKAWHLRRRLMNQGQVAEFRTLDERERVQQHLDEGG